MPRSKSTGAAQNFEEFVFWVRKPSLRYGFALQHDKEETDPYAERLSLSFQAECLSPDRLAGRLASAKFFHDADLDSGSEHRTKPFYAPKAVGSVVIGRGGFEIGGHLPSDALWRLSAAIVAGAVNSMTAGGVWVRRGHAHLSSLAFHGPDFDPIDYIG